MGRFELLDAVDELTEPTRTPVSQHVTVNTSPLCTPACEPGGHNHTAMVTHPALLDQLQDAVRGTMDTSQGSAATLAFTRNMVNSEALFHLVQISSQIRDWARRECVEHRTHPTEQLRAWYVKFIQTEQEEPHIQYRIRQLRKWGGVIRSCVDPMVTWTLKDPCPNPECTQTFDEHTGRPIWHDETTGEACTDPLVVMYRESDGPHMIERAHTRCRSCGASWTVRALAYELEMARGDHAYN